MKITILTENAAGEDFLAEHGISYFIEHDRQVLFDTGHSAVFLQNAKKLGVDILKQTDSVVLSHGHWDHGNGLIHLQNKKLITHPSSFMKRYRKRDHSYIGLNQSKEQIETHFNLQTSNKPYKVSEKIIFLGEIPRLNNFEAQATAFEDEFGNDDFVPDDSALAVILDHSIAVISGCAHAGICNTIEYAKKVTGINQVDFVLGGFHLKENNVQTQKTIDYFSIHNIGQINPSHCTQLPALSAFYEKFKIQQIKTGMQLFI